MKHKLFLTLIIGAAFALTTACGNSTPATTEATPTDAAAPGKTENTTDPQDLTTETAQNKMEREDILIGVKKELANMKLPDQGFQIVSIKTMDDFAFVMLDVKNADGSDYKGTSEHQDCCHAEILFQLAASQWIPLESEAFSTDVWYACLWKQFHAPRELFGYNSDTCP